MLQHLPVVSSVSSYWSSTVVKPSLYPEAMTLTSIEIIIFINFLCFSFLFSWTFPFILWLDNWHVMYSQWVELLLDNFESKYARTYVKTYGSGALS